MEIEFVSWEIEKKYEKVPKPNGGFYRMYRRDFPNASRELGYIVHESVAASPLLDLELFIKILKEKGIPYYIDFECFLFLFWKKFIFSHLVYYIQMSKNN